MNTSFFIQKYQCIDNFSGECNSFINTEYSSFMFCNVSVQAWPQIGIRNNVSILGITKSPDQVCNKRRSKIERNTYFNIIQINFTCISFRFIYRNTGSESPFSFPLFKIRLMSYSLSLEVLHLIILMAISLLQFFFTRSLKSFSNSCGWAKSFTPLATVIMIKAEFKTLNNKQRVRLYNLLHVTCKCNSPQLRTFLDQH